MATKGSNGVEDGLVNVQKFRDWQNSVEDFKPYVKDGGLNLAMVARESTLKRNALYTNTTIADDLIPALLKKLEKEGVLKPKVAEPARIVLKERERSPQEAGRMKQLAEQNEALTTENRELRAELDKLKVLSEVLQSTGRIPW